MICHFPCRDPKRLSGQLQSLAAAEAKSSTPTPVPSPATPTPAMGSVGAPSVTVSATTKPEMPRDADSDFAELNPLDDVDVSDQLIRKKEVGCWGVGVEVQVLEMCGDEWENRTGRSSGISMEVGCLMVWGLTSSDGWRCLDGGREYGWMGVSMEVVGVGGCGEFQCR